MSQPGSVTTAPKRVVLWGTCDVDKPRVRILRDGLRAQGVEVIDCHAHIWRGVQDKSQVGIGRWLALLARIMLAYPMLVWRYLRLPKHDWVLLGYPSILDVFVVRIFARARGARLAMDWFLSAYDTVVQDRRMVRRWHPFAVLLWCIEWLAVRSAEVVFMDTQTHARRMERLFRLRSGRCASVWVGAEPAVFTCGQQRSTSALSSDRNFRVLFYGQFIPLHGAPTIIEAARLLRDEPVEWLLIGRGQEQGRVRAMLDADPLPRLRWLEWVDYERLVEHLVNADVCLGIFGTSDKAGSVIPNKVFQAVTAGRPIITRDSPAIRELLDDRPPCVQLVSAGDAQALARAIRLHAAAARRAPVGHCHAALLPQVDPTSIGHQLVSALENCSTGKAAR